jgi:membrane protein CcdC involved in cytochrome C biogenesis
VTVSGSDIFAYAMIAVGFIAVAALLTFVIAAIVQVVRADIGYLYKVLWLAAIVMFLPWGIVAWYLIGNRTADVERAISAHTH